MFCYCPSQDDQNPYNHGKAAKKMSGIGVNIMVNKERETWRFKVETS
jgi:hypothetical protein